MNRFPLAILMFAGAAFAQAPPATPRLLPGAEVVQPAADAEKPTVQPVSAETTTMGAPAAVKVPAADLREAPLPAQRSRFPVSSGQRPEFINGGPN